MQNKVHFMGVCGVGMAGVAYLYARSGWEVSGCDAHLNNWADGLSRAGVRLSEGHSPAHIVGVNRLIVTPAVHPDNPELTAARAAGIPVMRRGEALAEFFNGRRGVAVCGTHGKTTTTCFTARLLQELGAAPGWCIGGCTESLGFVAGGTVEPGRAPFVVEADESDGTLALYRAAVLVVNNIDIDHLEHFKNVEDLHDCFKKAVEQAREGVVVCRDHPVAWSVAQHAKVPIYSFGFSAGADLRAIKTRCEPSGLVYTLVYKDAEYPVQLPVTGVHNILNSLGAVAAALALGFPLPDILAALPRACSQLPGRRFEMVFHDHPHGIHVVADYAHHPVELKRAVQMALLFNPKRLRVVFQPHRYTRTLALRDEFPGAFEGASEVILLPVYAASEDPILGGGIGDLYAAFRKAGKTRTLLAESLEQVYWHLIDTAAPGDFILIAGAGDIIGLADAFREHGLSLETGLNLPGSPVSSFSFYRVGGTAAFVGPACGEDAIGKQLAEFRQKRIPYRLVGMGSNSWFSDLFFLGEVVRLAVPADGGMKETGPETVEVSAGVAGGKLLNWLEERGLGGLECMDSIPGTVGGWLASNAGIPAGCIGDRVESIRCLNPEGRVDILSSSQCGFGYRACAALRQGIVLGCTLKVARSTPEAVKAARLAFRAKRLPLAGLQTCGSVFKNPPGDAAGRLLEAAGCKGLRVGGARVTDFHANIIATEPGATASDVLALALVMRNAVFAKSGVKLEPEIAGLDLNRIF